MNITLIDSHPVLRVGMSLLLTESYINSKVCQEDCLVRYSEAAAEKKCDLVIIGLSEENSEVNASLIVKIRSQSPGTEIIILAGRGHDVSAFAAISSGAKGYILKNNDLSEVLSCINSVMNGKRYLCREMAEILTLQYPEFFAAEA